MNQKFVAGSLYKIEAYPGPSKVCTVNRSLPSTVRDACLYFKINQNPVGNTHCLDITL